MLPVILLLSLVDFAQTDGGTVEIQFVRYRNWAHKVNYGGYCCESYFTSYCVDECDNYFIVCLREYNPTNDNKCTDTRTTGEFGDDVAFATGSSALRNGLSNPFSLNFNGAWKNSFSLKITIWDSDSLTNKDQVDILRRGVANAGISSAWTSLTIPGAHGKTLALEWRVQCIANYYGDCTVYCEPKDSGFDGHYTCDSTTGAKICRSGWKGAPQCRTPICKTGCSMQHGYCLQPNECICRSGWIGSNCLACIPRSGCVNGYCIHANECVCNSHWLGSLCNISGNGCKDAPCLNGATCAAISDNYTCTCLPDYSGPNCAIDMNRCRSSPCLNNGTCNTLPNNFACDCQPGYTGRLCSTEIDACSSDPCLYGNCSNFGNFFSCTCRPGFAGRLCATDIDECASGVNDCGANMLCENTIGGHTCKCQLGHQNAPDGLSCVLTQCAGDIEYLSNATKSVHFSKSDRRVNSSAVIVCKQGYSMNTETNSISLRCLDDGSWDGDPVSCKDIDECSVLPKPCKANEVCQNTEGSFYCRPSEPQSTSQPSQCSDGEANNCASENPNATNVTAGGDSGSGQQIGIYVGNAVGSVLLVIIIIVVVIVLYRRRQYVLSFPIAVPADVSDPDKIVQKNEIVDKNANNYEIAQEPKYEDMSKYNASMPPTPPPKRKELARRP